MILDTFHTFQLGQGWPWGGSVDTDGRISASNDGIGVELFHRLVLDNYHDRVLSDSTTELIRSYLQKMIASCDVIQFPKEQ